MTLLLYSKKHQTAFAVIDGVKAPLVVQHNYTVIHLRFDEACRALRESR